MRTSAVIAADPTPTAILQGPVEETIKKAAELGFDGVQLTIASREDYDIPALKALLHEHGLAVTALATGRIYLEEGLSMGSTDEDNRRACVTRLCLLADLASELGDASLIIGAVRGKTGDADSPEDYFLQFRRSLREVGEYCEPLEVPVILEVIGAQDSDAFTEIGPTREVIKDIGTHTLRMYFDTKHLHSNGMDVAEALREYGGEIAQLDISGEDRRTPMASKIDFPEAVRALKESGFDGVLAFEIDPSLQEHAAEESLKYIRALWDRE